MSFHDLVYLDKDFISLLYESKLSEPPNVSITKAQAMNAGAKVPLFSAGVSSTETKTYQLSTSQMLDKLDKPLQNYEELVEELGSDRECSSYYWITGIMTVQSTILKNKNGENEETYFSIEDNFENKLVLLASNDYFSSNISDLIKFTGVVVDVIHFKVKALVRIIPAKTSFKEWVAIPLIIREIGS